MPYIFIVHDAVTQTWARTGPFDWPVLTGLPAAVAALRLGGELVVYDTRWSVYAATCRLPENMVQSMLICGTQAALVRRLAAVRGGARAVRRRLETVCMHIGTLPGEQLV